MTRFTFDDPETDINPRGQTGRAPWRPIDAVVWAGTAVLVAATACAVGLAAGRLLPLMFWRVVGPGDPLEVTAPLMAVLGGVYGLVVGSTAGLLRGRPNRIAAGLKGGVGFAVAGAVAGGLGPLLSEWTGGRLPVAGALAVACALVAGPAGLLGYTWGRRQPEPAAVPGDDWAADPTLTGRPATPAVSPGLAVRQWPVLMVSAACLVVATVTPPSPAGWPMIGIALLGFAVAWVLAGQERRLRELEQRLRQREANEPDR